VKQKSRPNIANLVKGKHRTGVHISKVGPADQSLFTSSDIATIFQEIHKLDSNAIIVPATNKPDLGVFVSTMLNPQNINYTTMLDSASTSWGPRDQYQQKAAFSFYIASNIITTLGVLREAPVMSQLLKRENIFMLNHTLHETKSKEICYFLGESPRHTYREAIASDVLAHLHQYLPKGTSVPIQIKSTTAYCKDTKCQAIKLFVGYKDYDAVHKILVEHPLPDYDPIMAEGKYSNPREYQDQLDAHSYITEHCRAVKLVNTTKESQDHLRRWGATNQVYNHHVFRFARTSHTPTTGTIYVKCLAIHKPKVQQELLTWIQQYAKDHPDLIQPTLPSPVGKDDRTTYGSTASTHQPKQSLPPSKFQRMLDDQSLATWKSNRPPSGPPPGPRPVPPLVSWDSTKSYADAVSQQTAATAFQSTTSSPATSVKTIRELELEEENSELKEQSEG